MTMHVQKTTIYPSAPTVKGITKTLNKIQFINGSPATNLYLTYLRLIKRCIWYKSLIGVTFPQLNQVVEGVAVE